MRARIDQRIDYRHNIAVGMLDDEKPVFPARLADHMKIRGYELVKHLRGQKRPRVIAVIRAKQGNIQPRIPLALVALYCLQSHLVSLFLDRIGVIGDRIGEFIHLTARRYGKGSITMPAKKPRIAHKRPQMLPESLCRRRIRISPIGVICGNYGIIKPRAGVLLGIAGYGRAAHIVCGFIPVYPKILFSELESRPVDLDIGHSHIILFCQPFIPKGISKKLLRQLKFELKSRHLVGYTQKKRCLCPFRRSPNLAHVIPPQLFKNYILFFRINSLHQYKYRVKHFIGFD